MKETPFINRRYTKGIPFLSKMVYKRIMEWTSGWKGVEGEVYTLEFHSIKIAAPFFVYNV